jgi:hypothetical protein
MSLITFLNLPDGSKGMLSTILIEHRIIGWIRRSSGAITERKSIKLACSGIIRIVK